jgi:predicted GH43/DUF377 family glycosyl hydrolase
MGNEQKYQVSRFSDDGTVLLDSFAIADPTASVQHYFQPSAVIHNGLTHLYVVGYEASPPTWRIHLFTSSDNLRFTHHGVVFNANRDEPHGITQSNVTYDSTRSDPFIMYYVVRGPDGPGRALGVATSEDGYFWTRHGEALVASGSDEAYGISLGYVCRDKRGKWVLWYNAFDTVDLMHTRGKIAMASDPLGPFGEKTVIVEPDGLTFMLSSGNTGNAYGVLSSATRLPLGVPMVIEGVTQKTQEVVTPIRQNGIYVHFERPLNFTHRNRPLHSALRNKVLPTYARELPDGTWYGVFTTFGVAPGVNSEYTMEFTAPSLTGPWIASRTGLRFKPWFEQGRFSTENPTPLVTSPCCSQ